MVERDSHTHDDGDAELPIDVMESTASTGQMVRVSPVGLPAMALALRRPSYDLDAVPRPLDPRLVLLDEPHSARAASFRVIRDMLVSKGLPRVVAVSSAVPGDGKTTCVANLALALAEQPSTRVMLVDGNVFAPELGAMFKSDTMQHVTVPGVSLAPYRVAEIMPSLHLCAIPWAHGEPVPRVDQHRFDAMIALLAHTSYDYVLLDTPALRGTPATIPIVSLAGGALLVARSGTTTGRELRRAAEQLPAGKALGIALMDAPSAE